jgi:hypothetical protein
VSVRDSAYGRGSPRSGPQTKNRSPFIVLICLSLPSPHPTSPCLSAQPQSRVVAHSFAPFFSARSSGCRAVSFPRRRPRHAPSLPALLTYMVATCTLDVASHPSAPSPARVRQFAASCPSPHRPPHRVPSLPAERSRWLEECE